MIAKKFWAIMVAGLLLYGITGMALAADTQGPEHPGRFCRESGMPQLNPVKMDKELGKALDDLIAVNVLTVEQKGKIIEYFKIAVKSAKPGEPKPMTEAKKEDNDPIGLLVKDGVINQAQAAVIMRIVPRPFAGPFQSQIPPDPEKKKADLQMKLDGLVSSQVITAKQEDSILKFFVDKFSQVPGKKPGEKLEENKDSRRGPNDFYALLVQCNIITQKQADAIITISQAMPKPMPMERGLGLDSPPTPPDWEK